MTYHNVDQKSFFVIEFGSNTLTVRTKSNADLHATLNTLGICGFGMATGIDLNNIIIRRFSNIRIDRRIKTESGRSSFAGTQHKSINFVFLTYLRTFDPCMSAKIVINSELFLFDLFD